MATSKSACAPSAGYNVSKAAVALGGGGHPLAAGATIDGPLDAATKQVLSALSNMRDASPHGTSHPQ